ncbi:hypothetical protein G6F65_019404 [Rhizopus arrhizus]|nr:hypothetical protein G6F65_019404 [Rhizopus arrhizus]
MGGEAVAQAMRTDPRRIDPRDLGVALDQMPERLPGQCVQRRLDEQRRLPIGQGVHPALADQLRPRLLQVALQPVLRFLAQWHQAFLAALAGDPQHALAQVDRGGRQQHQFAHAQPCGIHQFEHGPVAQAQCAVDVRRRQQCIDLAFGQRLGQQTWQFRWVQQRAGVFTAFATAYAIGEERTQRRQQARIAARRPAMVGAPGQRASPSRSRR